MLELSVGRRSALRIKIEPGEGAQPGSRNSRRLVFTEQQDDNHAAQDQYACGYEPHEHIERSSKGGGG